MTENHNILVVDDEADSRSLLTGILASEGYSMSVRPTAAGWRSRLSTLGCPNLSSWTFACQAWTGSRWCRAAPCRLR